MILMLFEPLRAAAVSHNSNEMGKQSVIPGLVPDASGDDRWVNSELLRQLVTPRGRRWCRVRANEYLPAPRP